MSNCFFPRKYFLNECTTSIYIQITYFDLCNYINVMNDENNIDMLCRVCKSNFESGIFCVGFK